MSTKWRQVGLTISGSCLLELPSVFGVLSDFMKRALIFGVSGQDGAYLAKLLLEKGYEVHGTSRDHEIATFANLESLGIRDEVHLRSMMCSEFRSVLTTLQGVAADEIKGTDYVFVTMDHVVAAVADLFSQCPDEHESPANAHRRTNNLCSLPGHLVIQDSFG